MSGRNDKCYLRRSQRGGRIVTVMVTPNVSLLVGRTACSSLPAPSPSGIRTHRYFSSYLLRRGRRNIHFDPPKLGNRPPTSELISPLYHSLILCCRCCSRRHFVRSCSCGLQVAAQWYYSSTKIQQLSLKRATADRCNCRQTCASTG